MAGPAETSVGASAWPRAHSSRRIDGVMAGRRIRRLPRRVKANLRLAHPPSGSTITRVDALRFAPSHRGYIVSDASIQNSPSPGLPPVAPPSGREMVRMFIVPAVIVGGI